jgi:peptide chain release factor 1
MKNSDIKVETMRGQGPGGQRKNKTETCVRLTHIPTGINVTIDGRSQAANMRKAKKLLAQRLAEAKAEAAAKDRKARRDDAIRNSPVIRTYDYKRKIVKDHRTGKTASLKEVMNGYLDDLR